MSKIVFITGGMGGGGAERVISILANEFAHKGNDVSILQLLFSDCKYDLDPRINRIDISKPDRNQLLDTPRIILALRKKLNELKPDVVFSFMVAINIVSWIATRFSAYNLVVAERNDPNVGRSFYLKVLQNIVYANSNTTVFQTKRAQNYFSKRIRDNSVIIPNPIIVYNKAEKTPKNKLVTVGRLERQKNHKLLIEAFATIHKKYPEFSLDLYGDGTLRKEIEAQVASLGISENVIFHGNVKDIHYQISDAYMFILPSDYEGQSNALLEAQMMGLPCISTNCSGSDEAIIDGENGLLVPVGNKIALEAAIESLIINQNLRERIAEKALLSCEKYELQTVIKQWELLIDK